MRSPAGELSTGEACFFRPAADSDLPFTAITTMRPEGSGMRYNATVRHRDPEGREKHEKMGFHERWGAALEQLVAHANAKM